MRTATNNRRGRQGSFGTHRRTTASTSPRNGAFRGGRPRHYGGNAGYSGARSRAGRKLPTFDPSQFINTNPVDVSPEVYTPRHSFDSYGLNEKLVRTIAVQGMENPTPIQDQIIPDILKGHDVIGLAETGTGKTAAFLIPLIEKTLKDNRRKTLILAPTRELAIQIEQEFRKLAAGFRLFSVICVGGVNIRPQIQGLRRLHHFVIGTPGRVLDLMEHRHFRPGNITTVVLDEADRMLDMGFIHDMRTILSATPTKRETLLFSATMSAATRQLTQEFLNDPVSVSVKKQDVANTIEQDVVPFEHSGKFETLLKLLDNPAFTRVLIFGSMKHSVKRLAEQLATHGVRADSIHGNKNHSQRQMAMRRFKDGSARVLVATDVAARGIHVEDVSHVINYDLPGTFDDYVHRIGRTGRATKRGKALTFVPTTHASHPRRY